MKGMQGLQGISPLVSGLTLVGSESSAADNVPVGSPSVVRRRAPTRPSGTNVETVSCERPRQYVSSIDGARRTFRSTSTFGHGPKNKT